MFNKSLKLLTLTAALVLAGPALAQDHGEDGDMKQGHDAMSDKTVAGVAMDSPKFTTLVQAVKAAGLAEALKGDGPMTVFAPTNAAFEKLPEGTLDMLMQPENKDKLKAILTYHVVPENLTDSSVDSMIQSGDGEVDIDTLQGGGLTVTTNRDDELIVIDAVGNQARIVMSDLTASNGVVHAIDTVLMPM